MGLGGELAREVPRRTRWLGPALLVSVALGIGCGGGDGKGAALFTGGMKSFYEYARKHSQQG